ncbi:PLP-dependent aminotransferase family protein [Enterovirga rhinocerotis]|uniref:8-amino-7-oxononanoate synthase n=1 Tax=Enterovirga rhinocerotis TaxID=1339210 RepID=A0A4V3DYR2_9HYPH|nr:PLP-dependent aminotransferase family protein [Enterovirga rhinocerotis]TDR93609.1 GntR family transcriptional regulator [Enterovirga rhinocerotis]
MKSKTNPADWSALIPVLPQSGPRAAALYEAVRRLIEAGTLPPGAKLPTTRDLAARLGLSRAAAVAAFEMLIADGFAEARIGAGTFVAGAVPHLTPRPRKTGSSPSADPPPPGTLGIATADTRTLRTFRLLLSRHLARPAPDLFGYGDPRGGVGLREAVASYLRSARGVRCDADEILITTGTQHGLDLVIRTALAPGDPVWVEDPGYPMARAAFEGAGMRLVGVPVDKEGLDAALGEAAMPDARAVYVTPSHQFPLGVTMTMRRRLALIDWARRHGSWIMEDDYDSEFRYAGSPLTSLQGIDGSGRVIYLGTFSKVLFPGIRLGYAVLPEALIEPVLRLRARSDRQPPAFAEAALADLVREGHFAAHLRRARRLAESARDALVDGLSRSPHLSVTPPDQGLHLIAGLADGRSDTALVARAAACGLGSRALSAMHLSPPPQRGLVIGFSGYPPEVLRDAALRFVRDLDRHPPEPAEEIRKKLRTA